MAKTEVLRVENGDIFLPNNNSINNLKITVPASGKGTLSIAGGKTVSITETVTIAHSSHASGSDNQTITSGNGMNFITGNGDITITLGTPSEITEFSDNTVSADSHTHKITGFSLDGHTHDYLPLAGGALTGAMTGTSITLSGQMEASSFNASSKRELKENIETYSGVAVDELNKIKIVSFNFKNDEEKQKKIGFISDDTDSLFSGEKHSHMDIYNTVGVLIKAIQELDNRIKYLEEKYGI